MYPLPQPQHTNQKNMCTTKYASVNARRNNPRLSAKSNAKIPINCPKTGVAIAFINHGGKCIAACPSFDCHAPNESALASRTSTLDAYKSYAARNAGVVSVECALVTTAIALHARGGAVRALTLRRGRPSRDAQHLVVIPFVLEHARDHGLGVARSQRVDGGRRRAARRRRPLDVGDVVVVHDARTCVDAASAGRDRRRGDVRWTMDPLSTSHVSSVHAHATTHPSLVSSVEIACGHGFEPHTRYVFLRRGVMLRLCTSSVTCACRGDLGPASRAERRDVRGRPTSTRARTTASPRMAETTARTRRTRWRISRIESSSREIDGGFLVVFSVARHRVCRRSHPRRSSTFANAIVGSFTEIFNVAGARCIHGSPSIWTGSLRLSSMRTLEPWAICTGLATPTFSCPKCSAPVTATISSSLSSFRDF
ncbi:hypothetical protein BE221DRAFT_66216 [Ostreococcus tauri]|uniref:Uncharacterized protein n=1 Tax=Ostreococcus tauri TaxID=70448 RepID=A0A1Y5IIL8_OSTTA|nr:hypothetical protein BE221DRAFT_66216 [Ostreococcus tauri]